MNKIQAEKWRILPYEKKAASTFMLVKYVAVFEGERWKSGNAIFG